MLDMLLEPFAYEYMVKAIVQGLFFIISSCNLVATCRKGS